MQRDVSLRRRGGGRVQPVQSTGDSEPTTLPERASRGGESEGEGGRRKVLRRRKKRRQPKTVPLLVICALTVVALLAIILIRSFSGGEDVDLAGQAAEEKRKAMAKSIARFLDENQEECWAAFRGFLAAGTAAERAQYVRDAGRLAPMMEDYYRSHLPWTFPPSEAPSFSRNVYFKDAHSVGGKAIELTADLLPVEAGEGSEEGGQRVEVAFVKQRGRWVVDWEFFVRHSTERWQFFINRTGERQEGVFRVFMRPRRKESPGESDPLEVQFLPEQDGQVQWEQKTDWVEVDRGSEEGRRLRWILQRAEEPWQLGDSIFGVQDPPELHRVRVKLGWEGEERPRLILQEVQAGNWYGLGFEENFGEKEGSGSGS